LDWSTILYNELPDGQEPAFERGIRQFATAAERCGCPEEYNCFRIEPIDSIAYAATLLSTPPQAMTSTEDVEFRTTLRTAYLLTFILAIASFTAQSYGLIT
jgi:hypothetical protein